MKKKKAFYRSLPVHIAREAANLNIIAINELLEFYEPYLQKCAMNLLWDNETNSICTADLDELVQDMRIRIMEGIPNFRKNLIAELRK